MNHEPVSLVVSWLASQASVTALTDRVASQLEDTDVLPAIAVPAAIGGPVIDSSGMDGLYDWTLTAYCIAGRTGPMNRYPDSQLASQVAAAVVQAASDVATGVPYEDESGAVLVNAAVEALTRDTDDAGNAVVVVTLAIRVAD